MQQSMFMSVPTSPNPALQPKGDRTLWRNLSNRAAMAGAEATAVDRRSLIEAAHDNGLSPELVATFLADGKPWISARLKIKTILALVDLIRAIDPRKVAPADPALWQGMINLVETEEP